MERQLYEVVRNGRRSKETYREYYRQLKELIRLTNMQMNTLYIAYSGNKVKSSGI